MKCPQCKKDLIKGVLRNYETLCEHVKNPNDTTVRMRATFICIDRCAGRDAFYDPDGGVYDSRGCDCAPAIDSFDKKINAEIERDVKDELLCQDCGNYIDWDGEGSKSARCQKCIDYAMIFFNQLKQKPTNDEGE